MSDLPKELWHQGWTQEDWDRHCDMRRAVYISSAFFFLLGMAVAVSLHL